MPHVAMRRGDCLALKERKKERKRKQVYEQNTSLDDISSLSSMADGIDALSMRSSHHGSRLVSDFLPKYGAQSSAWVD
jgi:hypothetical protein